MSLSDLIIIQLWKFQVKRKEFYVRRRAYDLSGET